MKAMDDLLSEVARVGELPSARAMGVDTRAVESWKPRPRLLETGKTIIEPGVEPSGGFISAALAILRNLP